jgi:hypothetical protein
MRPMTRNESEVPATTIAWRVAEIVLLLVLALLTTPRARGQEGYVVRATQMSSRAGTDPTYCGPAAISRSRDRAISRSIGSSVQRLSENTIPPIFR